VHCFAGLHCLKGRQQDRWRTALRKRAQSPLDRFAVRHCVPSTRSDVAQKSVTEFTNTCTHTPFTHAMTGGRPVNAGGAPTFLAKWRSVCMSVDETGERGLSLHNPHSSAFSLCQCLHLKMP